MDKYIKRREALMYSLPQNSSIYIYSGKSMMRSEDEAYPFSVDRNFYYFTGIDAENMILHITTMNNQVIARIFIEPYDELLAKWVGGRMKKDEVTAISGINRVLDISEFNDFVNSEINKNRANEDFTIYLDMWHYNTNQHLTWYHEFSEKLRRIYPSVNIKDSFKYTASLRMIKDSSEVEEIRNAIDYTKTGIELMMKNAKTALKEAVLSKYFDLGLSMHNCLENAFPTIAACGKNATILHYSSNNSPLVTGQLFLCDLGGTSNHYCADISRTFPVNGTFTERQKEIYNVVLEGQRLVIDAIKPGLTTTDLNNILINYYREELPKIGLNKPVYEYYYHGVSHMLGLDTHDVDLAHGQTKLEKGHIITVEPGLYIEDEEIGVRIEDDILVTDDGCINLSCDILKTVEEIEQFMNN